MKHSACPPGLNSPVQEHICTQVIAVREVGVKCSIYGSSIPIISKVQSRWSLMSLVNEFGFNSKCDGKLPEGFEAQNRCGLTYAKTKNSGCSEANSNKNEGRTTRVCREVGWGPSQPICHLNLNNPV